MAQRRQKTYYDKGQVHKGYEIGDRVYLCDKIAKFNDPRWIGPFIIIGKVTSKSYKIQHENQLNLPPKVVSHNLLKLCTTEKVVKVQPQHAAKPQFLPESSTGNDPSDADDSSSDDDDDSIHLDNQLPIINPIPLQQPQLHRGNRARHSPDHYGDMIIDLNNCDTPNTTEDFHLKYLEFLEGEV